MRARDSWIAEPGGRCTPLTGTCVIYVMPSHARLLGSWLTRVRLQHVGVDRRHCGCCRPSRARLNHIGLSWRD